MKKALLCLLLALPMTSYASLDGYVGLGLGVSDISLETSGEDIFDPSASFAFRIGMIFSETIQLGLHVGSYVATAEDGLGNEYTFGVTPTLIELNYLFSGTRNGAYAGIAAGSVRESAEVDTGSGTFSTTDSETAYGATVGYNFQTGANHSFGVEGKYIQIDDDVEDYNMWSVHGTWNYWF